MAKRKTRLTPEDCAQLRHGMSKIQEALTLWQQCAKGDPEVEPLVKEAHNAYKIATHYLCEFGDGNPSEYD